MKLRKAHKEHKWCQPEHSESVINHTEVFFFIMFQKKSVLLLASSFNPDNGCNPLALLEKMLH